MERLDVQHMNIVFTVSAKLRYASEHVNLHHERASQNEFFQTHPFELRCFCFLLRLLEKLNFKYNVWKCFRFFLSSRQCDHGIAAVKDQVDVCAREPN